MKIEVAEYTDKVTGKVTEYHYVSKADYDALAANITKYGRHLPGCRANDWPVKQCNCGWDTVQKNLEVQS